jgi:hypothetical protein
LKQDKSQVNFASDLNKYQTFIYDTMTKFRQTYDIDLRVEILDDMLRTNFRKWLEITNKRHKEMMGAKSQIILVLDGAGKFTDEHGNAQSADWIPTTFPDRFKVVIIADRGSKVMQHFIQRKYPILLLRGLHQEQNFLDLCKNNDLAVDENPAFFDLV